MAKTTKTTVKKIEADKPSFVSMTFSSDTTRSALIKIGKLIIDYIDANLDHDPSLRKLASEIEDMEIRHQYEGLILEYLLNSNYTASVDFLDHRGEERVLSEELAEYIDVFISRYADSDVMSDEDVIESFDGLICQMGLSAACLLAPNEETRDEDWFAQTLTASHYIIVGRTYSVTLLCSDQ